MLSAAKIRLVRSILINNKWAKEDKEEAINTLVDRIFTKETRNEAAFKAETESVKVRFLHNTHCNMG